MGRMRINLSGIDLAIFKLEGKKKDHWAEEKRNAWQEV